MFEENLLNSHHSNLTHHKCLSLTTKTWSRDSHFLFDYESSQFILNKFQLRENTILTRYKSEVFAINVGISESKELYDEGFLTQIIQENHNAILNNSDNTNILCKLNKFEKDKNHSKVSDNKNFFFTNFIPRNLVPNKSNIDLLDKKIWYVLPVEKIRENTQDDTNELHDKRFSENNKDLILSLNDIVKLGRVKLAINEIHILSNSKVNCKDDFRMDVDMDDINININYRNNSTTFIRDNNLSHQEVLPVLNLIFSTKIPSNNEEAECKICFSSASDDFNPLIALCKCTGGLKYSHYKCLQKWMETKLKIKQNAKETVTSYNIKQFNCEICNSPYPFRFVIKFYGEDKIYDLIKIERPKNKNYLILESLDQLKDNKNIKSIHVITLVGEEKIILGRSNESDVRIEDISVSRFHSVMVFNESIGKVYLRDLKSKFGSLVLIKENVEVNKDKVNLQIGRTIIQGSVVEYKMKQNSSIDKVIFNHCGDDYNREYSNVHKHETFCFNQNICINNSNNNIYVNLWNTKECEKENEIQNKRIENLDFYISESNEKFKYI